MSAEGAEYEFMFGDTWCLIRISPGIDVSGTHEHKANPYVLGYRGRSLQAVGDREGKPLAFTSGSELGALAVACDYMVDRFGPRRAAPAPTTSYVISYDTSSLDDEPPLVDERPVPIVVRALDRIRRGDCVIVTGDDAKLAPRRVVRMPPGAYLASAVEDIEQGRHGCVREIRENNI